MDENKNIQAETVGEEQLEKLREDEINAVSGGLVVVPPYKIRGSSNLNNDLFEIKGELSESELSTVAGGKNVAKCGKCGADMVPLRGTSHCSNKNCGK